MSRDRSGIVSIAFSIALFCGVGVLHAQTPSPEAGVIKLPAPGGVALERAERRMQDAYAAELADKSDAGRHKLLQAMLSDASEARDDPDARYVLLRESRKLARALNDAATTEYASKQLETLYLPLLDSNAANTNDAMPSSALAHARPKLPVPPEPAMLEIRKKLKSKYASYYSDQTAMVRSALLKKLLDDADSASEATEQYATLLEAAEVSLTAGDLKTTGRCAATLAGSYQVEDTDVRYSLLSSAAHLTKGGPSAHDLVSAEVQLADDASRAGNVETAYKAIMLAPQALSAAKDDALSAAVKQRQADLRDAHDQALRIAPLLKKLQENPTDPDLNQRVGRFYCLTSGNWARGLPLLARGSEVALKLLAETELQNPATSDDQLRLADGWWDRSALETGPAAARCKERGAYWYRKVKAAGPTPMPERVTLRSTSPNRSVDLLATFNLARDRVNGQWTGGGRNPLNCTAGSFSRVQFPGKLPEEYDYIVQFTRTSVSGTIAQIIPVKNTFILWSMRRGISDFQSSTGFGATPVRFPFTFEAGKTYTSVVEVRKTGVRALIDGAVVGEWKTDFSDASASMMWKLRDAQCLGFGCTSEDVILRAARVVDVTGDSQ